MKKLETIIIGTEFSNANMPLINISMPAINKRI
jgi:hypothetical protein